MTAYQGGHLPRIEEAGHIAQEIKGDLLVMVALHAVCQILHHHSVASQQPLTINAGYAQCNCGERRLLAAHYSGAR